MDLNEPMNNIILNESNENNENSENTEDTTVNDNNNKIIFEENNEIISEESVIENNSDEEINTEINQENKYAFMDFCNLTNLMIVIAVLVLLYFVFQKNINELLKNITNSVKGLCN